MSFSTFYLENIVFRNKDNDPSLLYLKQIKARKQEEKKKANKKKANKKSP